MKEFYYDRQKLGQLVLINALMLCFMMWFNAHCFCYAGLQSAVSALVLFSFAISLLIALFPPRVALLDKEGIIIDRNVKLKWSEVKKAEKLEVRACLLKRAIIRLEPKKGKGRPWRLMQYVSSTSPFGAFSIPLYAMSKKDAEDIEKLMQKHVKLHEKH